MCNTPVTFGGGMTMEYAGRFPETRAGFAAKKFWSSQY
jgi:hypothetical protein